MSYSHIFLHSRSRCERFFVLCRLKGSDVFVFSDSKCRVFLYDISDKAKRRYRRYDLLGEIVAGTIQSKVSPCSLFQCSNCVSEGCGKTFIVEAAASDSNTVHVFERTYIAGIFSGYAPAVQNLDGM